MNIKEKKRSIRNYLTSVRCKEKQNDLQKEEQLNLRLQRWFQNQHKQSTSIGAYWPIGCEVDLRETLHKLQEQHEIYLPVVVARRTPLIFRQWTSNMLLEKGAFSTFQPPFEAPEAQPDILLVPLLGFDQTGNRLGYGGGFYDRTIVAIRKNKPVMTIGVAFSVQELETIPTEATDQPIDAVFTEDGWRELG